VRKGQKEVSREQKLEHSKTLRKISPEPSNEIYNKIKQKCGFNTSVTNRVVPAHGQTKAVFFWN